MHRKDTWVVVADASRARLLRLTEERHLVPAIDREIVSADLQSREIGSDRPGRVFDSHGTGRHAAEPRTDPKRHAKFELAHEVSAILEEKRNKQAFEQIVIVAPPQFLGDLRATLSEPVKQMVVTEINKDLSKLSASELETQLSDALPRH
jgi:protein required for attachment to host cells